MEKHFNTDFYLPYLQWILHGFYGNLTVARWQEDHLLNILKCDLLESLGYGGQ